MRNVEVKVRLADYDEALEKTTSMTGHKPLILRQVDTYFQAEHGRLKLREEEDHAELIFYIRPDQPGSKRSDYFRAPVEEPGKLKEVLARALSIDVVVEKTRNLFFQDDIRIHIDEVGGLGHFLEVEAPVDDEEGERLAYAAIDKLLSEVPGVSESISVSYSDMLRESR